MSRKQRPSSLEHKQEAAHSRLAAIIPMQALSCLVANFASRLAGFAGV